MSNKVTIQQLLNEIPPENIKFQFVNNSLLEASRETKKKPAFLKIGVAEEVAMNFLRFDGSDDIGMLIMLKRDDFEKAKGTLGL